ncbi:MAG: DNA-binding transcriptional MerR regulator [Myxococcota bacterium]|jgi:DNA-binding transcriptional MerR regulator
MGYRIKTVSELLQIPRNTLLAWERRYQVVSPARQDNGYREYSDVDIDRLREVKRRIDEGYKVSEAISMLEEHEQTPEPPLAAPTLDRVREELLQHLLRFDRAAADALVRPLVAVSYRHQINRIYFPMLRDVGDGWSSGQISIAQEHYISAFCRERLVAMLLSLECGPKNGPLAICAGYPGERHDLSLIALSVILAMRGKRILLLGADVPLDELRHVVATQAPELTCVSVMIPRPAREVVAFARSLSSVAKGRVVLGGRGLPAENDLPKLSRVEWVYDINLLS